MYTVQRFTPNIQKEPEPEPAAWVGQTEPYSSLQQLIERVRHNMLTWSSYNTIINVIISVVTTDNMIISVII